MKEIEDMTNNEWLDYCRNQLCLKIWGKYEEELTEEEIEKLDEEEYSKQWS